MIIQHNMQAMFANRELGITTYSKAKSQEKLSSGYKINRAADDAAGLTISEGMRRQIRGLDQGTKNAQDGVSMCQIADGALEEVSDMLHRITELSIKSANGTNTEQDRQAIQSEINELLCEIDRVSESTKFNDQLIFTEKKVEELVPEETEADKVYNRRIAIQGSMAISGDVGDLPAGYYTISASDGGLSVRSTASGIGVVTIGMDEIKNDIGKSISEGNPQGEYSFLYHDFEFSFSMPTGADLSDAITALDNTQFSIMSTGYSYTAINCTPLSFSQAPRAEEIFGDSRIKIYANADGIKVGGTWFWGDTVSWADLGIDDISNAGGKSFTYSDSISGVSFSGTISDDATEEEIYRSLNKELKWSWRNMRPSGNARDPYDATTINNAPISGFYNSSQGLVKVIGIAYKSLGQEWELTDQSIIESLSGMDVSVELITGSDGRPAARITNKSNGNYFDQTFSSFDGASMDSNSRTGYVIFGGNSDNGTTVRLIVQKPYGLSLFKDKNPDDYYQFLDYLGSLGTVATNVHVPGPRILSGQIGETTRPLRKLSQITPGVVEKEMEEENVETEEHAKKFWIQSGDSKDNGIWLKFREMNTESLDINTINVSTQSGARKAISTVEKGLDKLLLIRSEIGAQQNRLEHTIDNQNNIVENTTAAESRIRDADMATEMMKFTKDNILQQAGLAMLAQTNQSRQGILSLLQ